MKLPRNLSGDELARLLGRYGYRVTRQVGSHQRLTGSSQGRKHHITIPRHRPLRPGTLNQILKDVAEYLEMEKTELIRELFP